jgi:large subunit ribosomal protein L15
MNLHNLKPAAGSIKKEGKRIGRGEGSGKGGTAARGNKGAGSRSGTSTKRGFEGGQMPLYRRLPKVGFNLDKLQLIATEKNLKSIDFEILVANGVVSKNGLVKILGRGEINIALDIKAHAFSASAQKAIEAIGGSIAKI